MSATGTAAVETCPVCGSPMARRNGGSASAKLGGGANTRDVYHRVVDIRAQVRAEDAERRRRRW